VLTFFLLELPQPSRNSRLPCKNSPNPLAPLNSFLTALSLTALARWTSFTLAFARPMPLVLLSSRLMAPRGPTATIYISWAVSHPPNYCLGSLLFRVEFRLTRQHPRPLLKPFLQSLVFHNSRHPCTYTTSLQQTEDFLPNGPPISSILSSHPFIVLSCSHKTKQSSLPPTKIHAALRTLNRGP
jgi:hypothetical protein